MGLATQLITINDIRGYRELHDTLSSTKFSGFLFEVQNEHLRQLLGDALWYDFMTKYPDSSIYSTLFDGGTYEYDYETIYYPGLKPFLCWAWLSKYALEGNVQHTAKGNYDYLSDTGTRVEKWQINQAIEGYKQNIQIEENKIKQYLNEKSDTYSLWEGKKQQSIINQTFDII